MMRSAHYITENVSLDHIEKVSSALIMQTVLTRYMKRKKVIVKKKLIDQKTSDAVIDELEENIAMDSQDEPWVSYWWNNITVSLVHENGKIPSNVPPAILKCKLSL
jgi:hypothetical protein